MAHRSGLADRFRASRKSLPGKVGGTVAAALVASASLLPHLALAQLAPNSNYDGQNLSDGNYSGQDGSNSSFVGTDLSGTLLVGTNLTYADLTGADMTQANLWNANLSGSNISAEQLRKATTKVNVTLSNINMSGYDLSYLVTERATFDDSKLSNANLAHASMLYGSFKYVDFTGAEMSEASLYQSSLIGAALNSVNMAGSVLSYSNGTAASFRDANLTGAYLDHTNFTSADFTNANLSNTNLSTANLTNATLYGANLNGATLPDSMPQLPVIGGAVVTIAKGSKVTVSSATSVSANGNLVIAGTHTANNITINSGGTIKLVEGGNLIFNGPVYNGVNLSGTLSGTGTVTGSVFDTRGTIAPGGDAPGTLSILGNLSKNGGTFSIDIANLSSFSVLDIQATADFRGSAEFFGSTAVTIDLLNGYTPNYGDTFAVLMTDGGISGPGNFATPKDWQFFFSSSNTGALRYIGMSAATAVPEPGTLVLLSLTGLPLVFMARRRLHAG